MRGKSGWDPDFRVEEGWRGERTKGRNRRAHRPRNDELAASSVPTTSTKKSKNFKVGIPKNRHRVSEGCSSLVERENCREVDGREIELELKLTFDLPSLLTSQLVPFSSRCLKYVLGCSLAPRKLCSCLADSPLVFQIAPRHRLPWDIVVLVLAEADPSTLAVLGRVSYDFLASTTPLLYEKVTVVSGEQLEALFCVRKEAKKVSSISLLTPFLVALRFLTCFW